MMGYAFCIGACFCCHKTFCFNPVKVPSYPQNGVRQPVCRDCIALANVKRQENGLEPIRYADDAYDAVDERELS